jgi:hypothetical protein
MFIASRTYNLTYNFNQVLMILLELHRRLSTEYIHAYEEFGEGAQPLLCIEKMFIEFYDEI